MPITRPNFKRPPAGLRRGAVLVIALTCPMVLSGCAERAQPAQFFELSPESSANRAMQTRMFDTGAADELLSASAAALQDLGFQIEESVREVGLLRAAKERSAREYGQYLNQMLVWLLSFGNLLMPVDLHQKIAATIVTRPVNEDGTRHEVRIMFYRLVWKGEGHKGASQICPSYPPALICTPLKGDIIPPGEQKMEMIRDPEIYQQFFAKLSKAVFLEPHSI